MKKLFENYPDNIAEVTKILRADESFDVLKRTLSLGSSELTFFYVDGFVKDGELQRIMQGLLSKTKLPDAYSTAALIPYSEVSVSSDLDEVITAVLSGQTVLFYESFGAAAIILDLRTYPARETAEPESDRVMQGARDGFVETLIMNTALLRRRIRDPRLIMKHFDMGGASHTDVAVCYMDGVARADYVETVCKRIAEASPRSLTLGTESLAETLIKRKWYNPFPKIRTTERPDTAAAQVLEGNVLVFCDTSPEVMILPTSIFDFCEEADDYCFPPITGTYLRILRIAILLLSVVLTPLWYLSLEYSEMLPPVLSFLVPDEPGSLPIILQLFLAELALDVLKLASMNTPNMLSNSLSVVGGLILGDFAVGVGWVSRDVIFYMACVAIANFAQQSQELGYAFKFMRMITLALTYLFGIWGFLSGIALFSLAVATNNTIGKGHYLYPLKPFCGKAMARHLLRLRKRDFEEK